MAKFPDPMRLLNKAERLRHIPPTRESQKEETLEQLTGCHGNRPLRMWHLLYRWVCCRFLDDTRTSKPHPSLPKHFLLHQGCALSPRPCTCTTLQWFKATQPGHHGFAWSAGRLRAYQQTWSGDFSLCRYANHSSVIKKRCLSFSVS